MITIVEILAAMPRETSRDTLGNCVWGKSTIQFQFYFKKGKGKKIIKNLPLVF